jgi:hypothetical protein
MVISFAIQKKHSTDFRSGLLMGVGRFLYLAISFIFQKTYPIKRSESTLSDTLLLTGEYLKLRAKLVTKKTKRDQYLKQSFVLQNQINEKHETLRNNADGT